MESRIKRGYLDKDFRFFHLKDKQNLQFEHHYHEFNKIIVFIGGNVVYSIEGKSYKLKPWDVLFVPDNQVHKPIIAPEEDYERIVIWINNAFLEEHGNAENNLLTCFNIARENRQLLRLSEKTVDSIKALLYQIEQEIMSKQFGADILGNALFVQFMVYLNRLQLKPERVMDSIEVEYDEQIQSIIQYINNHLESDLSIPSLAAKFYVNKFYLMHKFKANTGFSVHNYISNKRLQRCSEMLKLGTAPAEAASQSGFNDYSSFVRAFTKMYGVSPRKYSKAAMEKPSRLFPVEG